MESLPRELIAIVFDYASSRAILAVCRDWRTIALGIAWYVRTRAMCGVYSMTRFELRRAIRVLESRALRFPVSSLIALCDSYGQPIDYRVNGSGDAMQVTVTDWYFGIRLLHGDEIHICTQQLAPNGTNLGDQSAIVCIMSLNATACAMCTLHTD